MRWFIIVSCSLALAACAPAYEKPQSSPSAPADALPPCPPSNPHPHPDTVLPSLFGEFKHFNCELQSHDSAGLRFNVYYRTIEKVNMPGAMEIDVINNSGSVIQTIKERLSNELEFPEGSSYRNRLQNSQVELSDLDGDGRDEVIIPLDWYRNGEKWVAYRATGSSSDYRRQPAMKAWGFARTTDGYFKIAVTGNSGDYYWLFYKITNTDYKLGALTYITHYSDGAATKNRCSLIEKTDLGTLGDALDIEEGPDLSITSMNRSTAQVHFCDISIN